MRDECETGEGHEGRDAFRFTIIALLEGRNAVLSDVGDDWEREGGAHGGGEGDGRQKATAAVVREMMAVIAKGHLSQ